LWCEDAVDLSRLKFAAKIPPLFHDYVLAPRALLKFVSSGLFAYCETTAGFLTVGHATIFCDCVLAPQELLKFVSSRLSAYCENTAGFSPWVTQLFCAYHCSVSVGLPGD